MPVYDLYSKRKKAASRAGQPDVYAYDDLPSLLRKQIVMVWHEAIGLYKQPEPEGYTWGANANPHWDEISGIMTREVESFHDLRPSDDNPLTRCEDSSGDATTWMSASI
jgi:hypothetical protein